MKKKYTAIVTWMRVMYDGTSQVETATVNGLLATSLIEAIAMALALYGDRVAVVVSSIWPEWAASCG